MATRPPAKPLVTGVDPQEVDHRIELAREILRLNRETDGTKDIYGLLPEGQRLAQVNSEIDAMFKPGTWLESPGNASENYNEERYKALNDERFRLMRAIEDKFTPENERTFWGGAVAGLKQIRFAPEKLIETDLDRNLAAFEALTEKPKNKERLRLLKEELPAEEFEKYRGAAVATDWKNTNALYAPLPDGRVRFRPEVYNTKKGFEKAISRVVADGFWTPQQGEKARAQYANIERDRDERLHKEARKTASYQAFAKTFHADPANHGRSDADVWKAYRDTPFYKRLPDIFEYLKGVTAKSLTDTFAYPGMLVAIEAMQSAAESDDSAESRALADKATRYLIDTISQPSYWQDVRGSGSGAVDAAVQSIGQLLGQTVLYKLGGKKAVAVTAPMQTAMEAYTSAYEAAAKYDAQGRILNGKEAHTFAARAAKGGSVAGLLDLLPLESVMAKVPNGGVRGAGKAIVSGLLEIGTERAQDRWSQMVNQAALEEYVPDQDVPWDQYAGMGAGAALTDFAKQALDRKIAGRAASRHHAKAEEHTGIGTAPPPPEASRTIAAGSAIPAGSPRKDDSKKESQSANVVGIPGTRHEDQTSSPDTTAPSHETADAEYQPAESGDPESGAPAPADQKNQVALSLLNEERARLLEQLANTKPNTATEKILTERLHELNTLATRLDTQGNPEPQLSHPPAQRQEPSESHPDPLPASGASRPSTRTRPDTNTSTADRPPGGTPAHPSRKNGAAVAILQQERNSLLQKLDTTDSQSAKGSILRERLGEINAQIDKFNNLPDNTPAPTNRKNGAALTLLDEEKARLQAQLNKTTPNTATSKILIDRLHELSVQAAKFENRESKGRSKEHQLNLRQEHGQATPTSLPYTSLPNTNTLGSTRPQTDPTNALAASQTQPTEPTGIYGTASLAPKTGNHSPRRSKLSAPPGEGIHSSPDDESESVIGDYPPREVVDTGRALYQNGMSYGRWIGRMYDQLGPNIAHLLGDTWIHVKGPRIEPAKSMAEALPILAELAREQRQLENAMKSVKPPTVGQFDWRYLALKSRLSSLAEESRELISVPFDQRESVTYSNDTLPSEIAHILKSGAKIVSRYVTPPLVPQSLKAEIIYSGDSHYAPPPERKISIINRSSTKTVAHEIAHDIEHSSYEMRSKVTNFLFKRARGGKSKPTSEYLNDPKYLKGDTIYFDRWKELGGDEYTGRFYPDGSTEILSTGIVRLDKNPAKFYDQDPEFFQFVVKTLRKW